MQIRPVSSRLSISDLPDAAHMLVKYSVACGLQSLATCQLDRGMGYPVTASSFDLLSCPAPNEYPIPYVSAPFLLQLLNMAFTVVTCQTPSIPARNTDPQRRKKTSKGSSSPLSHSRTPRDSETRPSENRSHYKCLCGALDKGEGKNYTCPTPLKGGEIDFFLERQRTVDTSNH